jgi:hypothetical protein
MSHKSVILTGLVSLRKSERHGSHKGDNDFSAIAVIQEINKSRFVNFNGGTSPLVIL